MELPDAEVCPHSPIITTSFFSATNTRIASQTEYRPAPFNGSPSEDGAAHRGRQPYTANPGNGKIYLDSLRVPQTRAGPEIYSAQRNADNNSTSESTRTNEAPVPSPRHSQQFNTSRPRHARPSSMAYNTTQSYPSNNIPITQRPPEITSRKMDKHTMKEWI